MRITTDLDLALREAVALYNSSQIFVFTDDGAQKHCLPIVQQTLNIDKEHIITMPSGDENKNLETLIHVWQCLSDHGATRKSLLLNLGGGVVTDLGAFAASTFKRGIDFVNISTTLLGAVDAATGGKCGINFNNLKNEIGLIRPAKEVIIYPPFFCTLSVPQFLSGYAEMLKHGLISSTLDTNLLLTFPIDEYLQSSNEPIITDENGEESINPLLERLITMMKRSLEIKQYIVEQDIEESSLRKSLNFGHTIGHAIEELSMQKTSTEIMPHGYAVIYGIVAELYISMVKYNFPKEILQRISRFVVDYYGKPKCQCNDYETLYQLMLHDKKNTTTGQVNFTFLVNIGNARVDQSADKELIFEALDYLMNL